jgi:acetate---CoA ligase (ADP-forming)
MPWTPARLERLFRPRSIALVGASERSNWARMIISTLERTGYTGRIELVNGRGGEVFGRAAVASLTDLSAPVDAAYVMVPSHLVLPSVQDGRDAGVRNFVVLSSGFAEAGDEGRVAQQQLREIALDGELAIIGPNTMGFINVTDGITLMPNSLSGLPPRGNVGLVTQSGALAGATLRYCEAQGIGLSKVIALGNEVVIGVAEVIDYLIDDPHTSAIAVMMEAIRSPDLFRQVAARALAAGIPIVALKAGRTEAGARVGAAHTGAMVDDDRVIDALCRQIGVVRVRSLEALVTTASVLARTGRPLSGNRLVVLGISGGACNIIADRAEDEGLRLEPFNTPTVTELHALVSSYGAINNPLDVTGAAVNDQELFGNLIRAVTRHADADVLVVQHDIPGPNTSAVQTFSNVLRAAAESERVPTVVVGAVGQSAPLDGDWSSTDGVDRILACGMDLAISAVGRAAWWSQRHRLGTRRAARTMAATIPEHSPGEIWPEERARALLADAGFPLVPAEVAATLDEAIAGAQRYGFPVVLKAIIPSVAHKSDVGAVELGVTDAEDLHAAAKRITERLAAAGHRAERFLVSPMRPRGVELIAGVVRDPAWGPVLAVGFGGTWAEVLSDTALRVLPIDEHDVRDMLAELRGASLLTAPRGLPPVDLDAVVAAVAAIARLADSLGDDLESIEVNPLWVRGSQVEGLDALVTWQADGTQSEGMHSDD